MITGYNTDIRHGEVVLHVQTEDKGIENPAIESVIYLKGQVLAAKRTAYAQLLEEGKGEREIASLMEQQHRTVLAAIRAGRFDARIGEAVFRAPRARRRRRRRRAGAAPAPPAGVTALPAAPVAGAAADEQGPSLDQVILQYLETEAEQEHLVLVLDGPEEIRPGRLSRLTLRAFSSKAATRRLPSRSRCACSRPCPTRARCCRARPTRRARSTSSSTCRPSRAARPRSSSPAPPTSGGPRSSSCYDRSDPRAAACPARQRTRPEAPAGWTVADLVAALAGDSRLVAVERNGAIVPRARWSETPLATGDRIEVVRFVQGG